MKGLREAFDQSVLPVALPDIHLTFRSDSIAVIFSYKIYI